MQTLIAIGGTIRDHAYIESGFSAGDFDLVIAADSGVKHLLEIGRVPTYFIGDMDSATPEQIDYLKQVGTETLVYPERKNESDTELAIEEALLRGTKKLVLYGSFGAVRPDHLLANLLMLERLKRDRPDVSFLLTDGLSFVHALQGPMERRYDFKSMPERPYLVSLLPISSEVEGLSYEGLSYPLEDARVERGRTLTISNYANKQEDGFAIRMEAGSALLILTPNE